MDRAPLSTQQNQQNKVRQVISECHQKMNDQGIRIKPNHRLSDIDKAFLTINYPSFVLHDPTIHMESTLSVLKTSPAKMTPLQIFQDALDVADIAGDSKNTIINDWLQGDWK
jgi:hypothetical protein